MLLNKWSKLLHRRYSFCLFHEQGAIGSEELSGLRKSPPQKWQLLDSNPGQMDSAWCTSCEAPWRGREEGKKMTNVCQPAARCQSPYFFIAYNPKKKPTIHVSPRNWKCSDGGPENISDLLKIPKAATKNRENSNVSITSTELPFHFMDPREWNHIDQFMSWKRRALRERNKSVWFPIPSNNSLGTTWGTNRDTDTSSLMTAPIPDASTPFNIFSLTPIFSGLMLLTLLPQDPR